MYILTLIHLGNKFYLRGTVWSSERTRATEYATQEQAVAALAKAKQFMKAKQFKDARIEDAV